MGWKLSSCGWLSRQGDGLAPSEPRFNSHWHQYQSPVAGVLVTGGGCIGGGGRWVCGVWHQYQSLVAVGRTSSQHCSVVPVKVLSTLTGYVWALDMGVNDIKFRCIQCELALMWVKMEYRWLSTQRVDDVASGSSGSGSGRHAIGAWWLHCLVLLLYHGFHSHTFHWV